MTPPLPHDVGWVAAGPLWKGAAKDPPVLRRPTLLGFAHDNFMDEVLATLGGDRPEELAARVASGPSRSYRARRPGEPFGARPTAGLLKLYQPVHGWFYLVAGSLVCRLPGLPDHGVDAGAGERAGFVLRRLDAGRELALVADVTGKKHWAAPRRPDLLAEGEELLPMFPLAYREAERRRKLLAGVIPAGSQDALQAAPIGAAPPDEEVLPGPAEALEEVKGRVTGAITLLQQSNPAPPAEQSRETTRFALMDLADFLTFQLPPVMAALGDGATLGGAAGALLSLLRARVVDPTVDGQTLADLLKVILATPVTAAFAHDLRQASPALPFELESALRAALEEARGVSVAGLPVEAQVASATLYVARLVYRRPHCGPLRPDVVSAPSEPFALAPYFDPDAPSRRIRIALPFDPTIKGLRDFRKNVRLVLSDGLRQAMKRDKVKDLDGPNVDCGGLELSIPIITIVATIILFIFLSLLNIIFWWLPFVKICLPKIKVEL